MVGVDVGCNLEDEAGELLFVGLHDALDGCDRPRTWCDAYEAVEELLHAEIVERAAEEDGREACVEVVGHVEGGINALDELQVVAEFAGIGIAYVGFEFGAADVYLDGFGDALFVGSEEVEALLVDVVDALELCPLIDRPRERADLYLEFVFEFVE